MSEVRGDDQEFFRALEALHMDPLVETVFEDIRAQNMMLAKTPMTEDEARHVRNKIDAKWTEVLYETATFTGMISRLENDKISKPKYREDKEYLFKGVELAVETDRNLGINRDDPSRIYQLYVYLTRTRESGELEKFMAKTENIASLEFAETVSYKRAVHLLRNYEPKLLECVEYALSNPNEDESLTAMGLEGLVYADPDPDEDVTALVARALNTYVESNITFDTNIGYVISIDGETWQHSGALLQIEAHTAPASIEGVEWRARPKDFQIAPHFRLHLSGKTSDDEPETLFVPLDAVSSVYSLRHKFWQDHNKNPSD